MKSLIYTVNLITLLFFFGQVMSQNSTHKSDLTNGVFNTKPEIMNKDFKAIIPIEVWQNKIFLTAKVNGKNFRFILDTGSPTLLTKKVANELGLEKLGENTGQDANGTLVTMDLSILEKLELNGVTIKNIPVFIFDPSHSEVANELFDGGIIGSEIMPLANWQINFKDKNIILTDKLKKLNYVNKAKKAKLKIYNYPFMPIIEFQVNNQFKDNALFDTGNTELLHLYEKAFDELKKHNIISSNIITAYGTFGESGGGRGKDQQYYSTILKKISMGKRHFKNTKIWTRPQAPSLIGAKIFESQIVTLDYSKNTIYFYQYQEPLLAKTLNDSFGFKPYIKNQSLYIGFIIEGSPAFHSGLKLHDQILKINGKDLTHINQGEQLATLNWLSEINDNSALEIKVRNGNNEKNVILQK